MKSGKLSKGSNFHNILAFLNRRQITFKKEVLLGDQVIDLYIPGDKIGIDLNGLTMDTELNGKDRQYFIKKKEWC